MTTDAHQSVVEENVSNNVKKEYFLPPIQVFLSLLVVQVVGLYTFHSYHGFDTGVWSWVFPMWTWAPLSPFLWFSLIVLPLYLIVRTGVSILDVYLDGKTHVLISVLKFLLSKTVYLILFLAAVSLVIGFLVELFYKYFTAYQSVAEGGVGEWTDRLRVLALGHAVEVSNSKDIPLWKAIFHARNYMLGSWVTDIILTLGMTVFIFSPKSVLRESQFFLSKYIIYPLPLITTAIWLVMVISPLVWPYLVQNTVTLQTNRVMRETEIYQKQVVAEAEERHKRIVAEMEANQQRIVAEYETNQQKMLAEYEMNQQKMLAEFEARQQETAGQSEEIIDQVSGSGDTLEDTTNYNYMWHDAPIPDNAPPADLHILSILSEDDRGGTHPWLISRSSPTLKVSVINVQADDTLTIRAAPHHEIPWSGHFRYSALSYNAKNIDISGCWNLNFKEFIALSEWAKSVQEGQRSSGTWCFVQGTESYPYGWVNAHFLTLDSFEARIVDPIENIQVLLPETKPSRELDEWSRIDKWFLFDHVNRIDKASQRAEVLNRKADLYGHLSDGEQLELVALLFGGAGDASMKFLFDTIEMIKVHPDWNAEDITFELNKLHNEDKEALSNPLFKSMAPDPLFGLDYGVELPIVESLIRLQPSEDALKERVSMLFKTRDSCVETLNELRPTQRPSDPEHHCASEILSRKLALVSE
ncbi:hypothetical protein [Hirschia litorea]|uniref:Uncharacterized protein n=1 Tax=Hirschia litorea TaxID=1199156 RepID=A0ABW2ING7_9PROT